MADYDPVSQNVEGVRQLIKSKLNKIQTGTSGQMEGVEGEFVDELTLKLDDKELMALAKKWTLKYQGYEARIKAKQEANKQYYLGQQKEGTPYAPTEGRPISANLLFEATETFLPAALSKNPEPVVFADNTEEGNKLSNNVKTMLQYHADILVLRRKLTLMVRHWSIYFLGIIKHGWDNDVGDIKSDVRDPRDFILDPDGYVDSYGDYIGYLGERITLTADKLIEMFPKHSAAITLMCDGKLGTEVSYTEWWTDDYCFYTFKDLVLDKHKNEHFNPEKKVPVLSSTGEEEVDEEGKVVMTKEKGRNHFAKPKKPYTFLSVFSLGEQPHDITGLIEQNISNQRRITRRTEQIDFNLSKGNNTILLSENNFNQETGKQAAVAMGNGRPILVPPGGPISEAVVFPSVPTVGQAFFTELETSKNDLRSIFGTQGITAQHQNEDQTARGMILNQQYDNSRIGGGIGDVIEQVADNIFNWWVQLYYVYYDEKHFGTIIGRSKATEYVVLRSSDLDRQLVVSVSPDSMKPKDEVTQMNQAMSLWKDGAIDPKTLLTILNFPDPQQSAEQAVLWLVDKNAYFQLNFPELAQKLAAQQAPPVPGGPPPEQVTEPPAPLGGVSADPSLSTVPLPKL